MQLIRLNRSIVGLTSNLGESKSNVKGSILVMDSIDTFKCSKLKMVLK